MKRKVGKENKSQNPFHSIIQLPTNLNYLVIDFGPTTNNYKLFWLSIWYPSDSRVQWRCDRHAYCRMDRECGAGLWTLCYEQSGACLATMYMVVPLLCIGNWAEGRPRRNKESPYDCIYKRCIWLVYSATVVAEQKRGRILGILTSPGSAGWGTTAQMLDDIRVCVRVAVACQTVSPAIIQDKECMCAVTVATVLGIWLGTAQETRIGMSISSPEKLWMRCYRSSESLPMRCYAQHSSTLAALRPL